MRLCSQAVVFAACVCVAVCETELSPPAARNMDIVEVGKDTVSDHWQLGGSAAFVGDVVRLTPDEQSMVGFIQGRTPLRTIGMEWVVDVEVRLSGQGITLFGDGMALWMTASRFKPGPVFGHASSWTGVGVFIDTYDNTGGRHTHKHPYVSAMYNDGTLEYFHDASGTHSSQHSDVGCSARVRQYGAEEKVVALRLSYRASRLTMRMHTGRRGDNARKPDHEFLECFTLKDIHIPPGYYIGMSASTGDLTDAHDVLSLKVRGQVDGHEGQVPDYIKAGWPASEGRRGDTPALDVHGRYVDRSLADAQEDPPVPSPPPKPVAAPPSPSPPPSRPPPPPPPSVEDSLAEINDIIADTEVLKLIQSQADSNRGKLQAIHDVLDAKAAALHQHLQSVLDRMQATEDAIEERLEAVERAVAARVEQFKADTEVASSRWRLPFVLLVCGVVGAAAVAYRRWRQVMKTHML